MVFEGVRRSSHVVAGVRQDTEIWSILADEWPGLAAAQAAQAELTVAAARIEGWTEPIIRTPDVLHLPSKSASGEIRRVGRVHRTTREPPIFSYPAHRRDFVSGMRAMVPWLIGTAPFGLVIGVSAAQADIPTLAGWLTGPVIFSGSAQVATIQMLDAGAAAYAVIITALVINLRLLLYSAAIARYWRGTPLWWRLLGGYLLVDPTFVVGTDRYDGDPTGVGGTPIISAARSCCG